MTRLLNPPPMSPDMKEMALVELRELLVTLSHCRDARTRRLICTPCDGNYGCIAHWAIVVNGSPPRGTLIVGQQRYSARDDITFISEGRAHRLGCKQALIVRKFEDAYLWVEGGAIDRASIVTIPDTELDVRKPETKEHS